MILVAGLGNPGPRYADTRHNVGFRVVDRLAARASNAIFRDKFHGSFASVEIAGHAFGLLKPATFMNDSGRAVQPAMQFYKLPPSAVVIVYDELDLPFGTVRLKVGGGAAGHKGIKSVIEAVGGDVLRLRVGIGRPPPDFRGDGADFVLQGFAPAERDEVENVIDRSADAVVLVATQGISVAMNATNQRSPR